MALHGRHRPLKAYFRALEKAGFLVEALREPAVPDHAIASEGGRRWQRRSILRSLGSKSRGPSDRREMILVPSGRVLSRAGMSARNAYA